MFARIFIFTIVLLPNLNDRIGLADEPQAAAIKKLSGIPRFGYPIEHAHILRDNEELTLYWVHDDKHLAVQVVLWNDSSDALGETADGRDIGDNAYLVIDANGDKKQTPKVDRTYMLNPWPSKPGLNYSFPLGRAASSSNPARAIGITEGKEFICLGVLPATARS